ncbi:MULTISPECIES: hypothetical protein [unclassified Helicobacter]|uniref:hypothetical protein n=1 Tax=unclassified Helicobacter TaxID=2593540 RepID=UPI000CF114B4|nr:MULTISPECIES: hypothetical protein [unclassified Helicobacter]
MELVFVIVLLGVLTTLAFRQGIFISEKKCNSYLSLSLKNFQNEISLFFTQKYFLHQKNDGNNFSYLQEIFQRHTQKNHPLCSLTLHQDLTIAARNKEQKTLFTITPKDLSSNLKIQCNFSNPLCKKIHSRYSTQ